MNTSSAYHRQTAEFSAQLIKAVPEMTPDAMQGWIENPEALRRALAVALFPPRLGGDFHVWATVTVGNLGNAKNARKQLKTAGIDISGPGDDVLERVTFSETETTLALVRASVKELGLKDGAAMTEIYGAAQRIGLSLCPAEVALHFWLQHLGLVRSNRIVYVASEPIEGSDQNRYVFRLFNTGREWLLDAHRGHGGRRSGDQWIFVRNG